MMRTVKELEEELYDMRKKSPEMMNAKTFQFHIFVTSVPEDTSYDENEIRSTDRDSDLGIWGPHYYDVAREEKTVQSVEIPFDEYDIYRMLKQPSSQPTMLGDVIVHKGRPDWHEIFGPVATTHAGSKIGVMFCGPDIIAKDLKVYF